VYAIVNGNESGWTSGQTVGLLAAAVALLAAFFVIESRVSDPLVPLTLLRRRNLAIANVMGVLWAAAMFAWLFLWALYLRRGHGLHPDDHRPDARRAARALGSRVGSRHHVLHDGRRARARGPCVDRGGAYRGLSRLGRGADRRPHRRLPRGVRDRRGLRNHRRGPGLQAAAQPVAGRAAGARDRGARDGRRLDPLPYPAEDPARTRVPPDLRLR